MFIDAIESSDLMRVNQCIKNYKDVIKPSFAEEGNEHLQQKFEEVVTDKNKSIEDKLKAIAKIDPKLRRLLIEELKLYNSNRAEHNSLFEQQRLIAGLTLFTLLACTAIIVAIIFLTTLPFAFLSPIAILSPIPEMLILTSISVAACMPGTIWVLEIERKKDKLYQDFFYDSKRKYYHPDLLQELNNIGHQKMGENLGAEIEMRDLRHEGNKAPNLNDALMAANPSNNAAASHPAARHLSSASIALEQGSPLVKIPLEIDISGQKQKAGKEASAPEQERT